MPQPTPTNGYRPFFSVVLPTRERAHLLRYALQSALAQTFEDYEILVCDNRSTDGTEEVVREMADDRVRYIRTEKRLSMPDNWEFAFEHVQGRYVTYLGDDDAISPHLLEKLYGIFAETSHVSVGWKGGAYFFPDWPEKEARRSFYLAHHPVTRKVLELSSSSLLERLFDFDYIDLRYPLIHHACCSKDFLDQRKQRMGRLFYPTCPDFSSAVAVLTGTDYVLFVDDYLAAYGMASASNGSFGFPSTNAIETFMSEFSDIEKIWRIPLTSNTSYNQIAVTLIALRDVLAEELEPYSLSIPNLFIRENEMIELIKARGGDVSQIVKDWDRALSAQSPDVQRAVREVADPTTPKPVARRLRAATRRHFPALVHNRHFVRTWLKKRGVPVTGPTMYKFDNIFEAARALGELR